MLMHLAAAGHAVLPKKILVQLLVAVSFGSSLILAEKFELLAEGVKALCCSDCGGVGTESCGLQSPQGSFFLGSLCLASMLLSLQYI